VTSPLQTATLAASLLIGAPLAMAGAAAPEIDPVLRIETAGRAARYLRAIELIETTDLWDSSETTIELGTDTLTRIDLGFGDAPERRIVLAPVPGSSPRFRIEQQYETSVSLAAEGPHMDLVDWKHFVSTWEPLDEVASHTFVSRDVVSDEFPEVTTQEIVEAVEAESRAWEAQGWFEGDRWIRLAEQCRTPWTYPCGVAVSTVRLRISVRAAGRWKLLHTIEMTVPMGC
jgi:hypothetical protein